MGYSLKKKGRDWLNKGYLLVILWPPNDGMNMQGSITFNKNHGEDLKDFMNDWFTDKRQSKNPYYHVSYTKLKVISYRSKNFKDFIKER